VAGYPGWSVVGINDAAVASDYDIDENPAGRLGVFYQLILICPTQVAVNAL